MLYSWSLLFIYFIYKTVPLLIPHSYFILPHPFPFGKHICFLSHFGSSLVCSHHNNLPSVAQISQHVHPLDFASSVTSPWNIFCRSRRTYFIPPLSIYWNLVLFLVKASQATLFKRYPIPDTSILILSLIFSKSLIPPRILCLPDRISINHSSYTIKQGHSMKGEYFHWFGLYF